MYSASICKVILRIYKRKYVGVNFPVSSHFTNWCIWSSLSSERRPCKDPRQDDHMKRCLSSDNIQAFLSEDTKEINEWDDESRDAITVGPPEELVQNLGEENQQKLKKLWMELKEIRLKGYSVPKKLSIPQWQAVMEKETFFKKIKFCRYLHSMEARKEGKKQRREEQQLVEASNPLFGEENYEMNKNNIFLPISNHNRNIMCNSWQCQAIQFGQSIVVDLGFEEHMGEWEKSNCAQQIIRLYGCNKTNRQPFHLHLCNATPDSQVLQFLEQRLPNLYSHMCMITVTEKSYLDIFPKEQLVYLTPHCINDVMNYDHNAVYIIGGMVDKRVKRAVSMDKAQGEGIAMGCLPIYHYLKWSQGTKSLTLDQVMKIMLDIKNTGCWNTALKHVPQRKLKRRKNKYSNCETSVSVNLD